MAKLMLGTQEVSPTFYSEGYKELPSYQVSNGTASRRSKVLNGTEFSGITAIDTGALRYAFYMRTELTGSLYFPDLIQVSDSSTNYAFFGCTGLTSANFPSLTTVGSNGLSYAFCLCTGLTSVDLSSVTTVSMYGLENAFRMCSGLTQVSFTALETVDTGGFNYSFYGCSHLTDVYFNSITTRSFIEADKVVFVDMLYGTGSSVTHTLHFPSNLQNTISRLQGYPNFGGTSGYVVLAFDLPETS